MVDPEHDNLEADLSAYLDGELSEPRTQAVEHLLAESAAARRTLEDLRHVRDQLAALPRLQLPAELADALVRRAEQDMISKSAPAAHRARRLRLFGPLTAVAAVLVAGAFIGYRAFDGSATTGVTSPVPLSRAERVREATPLAAEREAKGPALAVRRGATELDKRDRSKTEEPGQRLHWLGKAAKSAPPAIDAVRAPTAAPQPESALAEAPTDAGIPATLVAVVIQTQHEADYVSNAAVLASWGGGAGALAVAGDQPIEQVYQCQAPELAYRLNQILAANPRGQVEVQQGRAAESSSIVAQVAEALGAPIAGAPVVRMGVPPPPPAPEAEGDGVPDSALRPASGERGAKRGAEPAESQRRRAGRESDTMGEELHRRHMAVTEEPDLTIVLVEPPAARPARALAPVQKKAAPPAEQSPKEALLDQLMGLLVRGGPRGAGGQQPAQTSDQPITLRVRLLRPPSPTTATTSQAAPQAP